MAGQVPRTAGGGSEDTSVAVWLPPPNASGPLCTAPTPKSWAGISWRAQMLLSQDPSCS